MARRVKTAKRDGLAWITLSALDEQGNAAGFDPEMRRALLGALDMVFADHPLRAGGGARRRRRMAPARPIRSPITPLIPTRPISPSSCAALAGGARAGACLSERADSRRGFCPVASGLAAHRNRRHALCRAGNSRWLPCPLPGDSCAWHGVRAGRRPCSSLPPPGAFDSEAARALGLCESFLPEITPDKILAALDHFIEQGGGASRCGARGYSGLSRCRGKT